MQLIAINLITTAPAGQPLVRCGGQFLPLQLILLAICSISSERAASLRCHYVEYRRSAADYRLFQHLAVVVLVTVSSGRSTDVTASRYHIHSVVLIRPIQT